MLQVAHRAGNDLATLRTALAADADLVEADVHSYRGRLEVRHRKTLGPWLLWETDELVRRSAEPPLRLHQLLAAVGDDSRLMLDLKGVHPWLAGRLARRLPADSRVTVSTQHWWMLRALRHLSGVRLVLSAGSRRGLRRLRRRLRRGRNEFGVCVHRRLLTTAVVTELRRAGCVVLTWPVESDEELRAAYELGVDGVIGKRLTTAPPASDHR